MNKIRDIIVSIKFSRSPIKLEHDKIIRKNQWFLDLSKMQVQIYLMDNKANNNMVFLITKLQQNKKGEQNYG